MSHSRERSISLKEEVLKALLLVILPHYLKYEIPILKINFKRLLYYKRKCYFFINKEEWRFFKDIDLLYYSWKNL